MRLRDAAGVLFGTLLLVGLCPSTLFGQQADAPFLAGLRHYEAGAYELAEAAFRESAESNPFHRDARFKLLSTLYSAQRWSSAVPVAVDLLELDPLNGRAFILLARCFAELAEREKADEVFSLYQSIGYEVKDLRLEEVPGEGTKLMGVLQNNNRGSGEGVLLRFQFGGEEGQELGVIGIDLKMPDKKESVEFEEIVRFSEHVVGFRYVFPR